MFIGALDAEYNHGPLAREVFLTGGGAEVPEIGLILRAGDWLNNFSDIQSPSVRILNGNTFFEGDSLDGFVRGPDDAGLAALIHYAGDNTPLLL